MATIANKQDCLMAAVEITKEYTRGNNGQILPSAVPDFLEAMYTRLVSLMEKSK